MLAADYPLTIIPVNFGVKFKPPKLGLEYTTIEQPMVQLIHEIALQPMLDKHMGIEDMTNNIFAENKFFLHTRVIAKMQVQRLIEKVISRLQAHQVNKENNSNKFNQQKAAAPSILVEKEAKAQQK